MLGAASEKLSTPCIGGYIDHSQVRTLAVTARTLEDAARRELIVPSIDTEDKSRNGLSN